MDRKIVFITGASSGIGKAVVSEFAKNGWQVAATMRSISSDANPSTDENIKYYRLDVTEPESIESAIKQAVSDFGHIDVLINNAGFSIDGVFEAISDDDIKSLFDTNVFGLMRVTRAFIPIFREQKHGLIIQVASMGGRIAVPLWSIYHASKWAVEGFSESLHYELEPFGIRMKIIEPGLINTDFYGRSRTIVSSVHLPMYDNIVRTVQGVTDEAVAKGEDPNLVASVIYQAAVDGRNKFRYAVGKPAPQLLFLRRILPTRIFLSLVKRAYHL